MILLKKDFKLGLNDGSNALMAVPVLCPSKIDGDIEK